MFDDDAPEQEPDQVAGAGEARPLDGLLNPRRELFRHRDGGVLGHARASAERGHKSRATGTPGPPRRTGFTSSGVSRGVMAVRPPQDDDEEPENLAFGIAALDARLDEADVEWPATDSEVLTALGDPSIPYDASGNEVALADVLDRVPVREYDSETELLNALHPVFEEYRENSTRSVIGQLRALLPF